MSLTRRFTWRGALVAVALLAIVLAGTWPVLQANHAVAQRDTLAVGTLNACSRMDAAGRELAAVGQCAKAADAINNDKPVSLSAPRRLLVTLTAPPPPPVVIPAPQGTVTVAPPPRVVTAEPSTVTAVPPPQVSTAPPVTLTAVPAPVVITAPPQTVTVDAPAQTVTAAPQTVTVTAAPETVTVTPAPVTTTVLPPPPSENPAPDTTTEVAPTSGTPTGMGVEPVGSLAWLFPALFST